MSGMRAKSAIGTDLQDVMNTFFNNTESEKADHKKYNKNCADASFAVFTDNACLGSILAVRRNVWATVWPSYPTATLP